MSRLQRILIFVAAAVSAVSAASASGAVVIGSTLAADATANLCVAGFPCTYMQTVGGVPSAVAPSSGVITSWRVKSGSAGAQVRLRVIRSNVDGGYVPVPGGEGTVGTTAAGVATFPSRVPIFKGGAIGLDNATSALLLGVAGEAVYIFNPALPEIVSPMISGAAGARPAVTPASAGRELLLNATLEPDGDEDGYGDESQDTCPTDSSRTAPPCAPAFAVSKLTVTPATLRAPLSAPARFTVRLTSTRPGTVFAQLDILREGRKVVGGCVPTDLGPGGVRCTLQYRVRNVIRNFTAGTTSFPITVRRLPAGRYLARLALEDRYGPGVVRRTFVVRIVRR